MTSVRLGDVANVISGYAFKSAAFKEGGSVPVLKIKNIKVGTASLDESGFVSESFKDKLAEKFHVGEDDILISLTGSHMTQPNSVVGRVGRYPKGYPNALLNQRAGKIIPETDKIHPDYLYYVLMQDDVRRKIAQMASGAASQANVSPNQVKSIEFLLPQMETQKRLGQIFKNYDNLIENNNRYIAILEDMAQFLYREWFVHFRFPGHQDCQFKDSELGRIPEGWEVNPIAEEIEILGGGTPKKSEFDYWDEEIANINWFTPSNLTKHSSLFIQESDLKITELGLKKSSAKLFPAYSVMMTSRATIGVISINTEPACTNQGFIVCIPNERISTEYIYYWLIANMQIINNLASGATFKEVRRTLFKELPFLIPNKEWMNSFNELVKPITKNIEVLISKNRNLKTQRDMLLPKLISGKIEV